MELSQLLAGSGNATSLPLGKGEGKPSGNGDAEFARVYKQAGETMKARLGNGESSSTPALTLGISHEPSVDNERSGTTFSVDTLATLNELLESDPSEQNALIAALPGELPPLTQQVVQAIEGSLLGGAQPASQQNGESTAMQAGSASSIATTLSSLPAGDGELLADIRQRMNAIASAQRGDTLPAEQGTKLAANAAQLVTDANSERAITATADSQSAGLRHQQLTAQGMQALTQQGTTLQQMAPQPTGNFADAIAAVTADDNALPTRHGSEGSFSQSLLGMASPTGTAANAGNASMLPTGQLPPTLTAPLASAQWQQGLGQQLVALHQRGGQQVELHLHPAELGPLSISLKMDDQLAQAQFFSANPQVRAAVEQAIPQLREALEESGIQLGEAMVGEHQQRDDGRDQASGGNRAMASLNEDGSVAASDDTMASARASTITTDSSAIDLYA